MKKNIFFFCFFLLSLNLFAQSKAVKDISSIIEITHNGKIYYANQQMSFRFETEEFDIFFRGLNEKQAVYLFCTSNIYSKTLPLYHGTFPVKTSETIFSPGNGLAESPLNPDEGYNLSLTSPNTFHYIIGNRRIDTKDGALIPVKRITDPTGLYTNQIYLTFFIDFNNNAIIETNELCNISINFSNVTTPTDFSPKNKAYVSSMGYSIQKGNYEGQDFEIYELHSTSNLKSFYKAVKSSFVNKPIEKYIFWAKPDEVFKEEIQYIILLPKTHTFVNNPFRIKGNKTLYFEIREVSQSEEKTCPLRSITVPNDEKLSIALYDSENDNVIKTPVHVYKY